MTYFSHPLMRTGDRNGAVSLGIGACISVLDHKSEKLFVLWLEARNATFLLNCLMASFLSDFSVSTLDSFSITEINSLGGH